MRTKQVKLEDKIITVKELTVSDIDGVLKEIESKENTKPETFDLLVEDMPLQFFEASTSLDKSELETLSQSDIMTLKEAIESLNPLLKKMLNRLIEIQQKMLENT